MSDQKALERIRELSGQVARLEADNANLRDTLSNIADKAYQATMVQNRSVGIIKQTCAYIRDVARAAIAKHAPK